MAYHIADKEAIRIVGIRTRLTENIEENQINIPIFWKDTLQSKRFMDICELSNRNPNGILGISVYQDPENIFYYIAAATTKEIPIGMYECEIPAATWVIFENDGPFKETVQTIFQRFYTEWLPFSGYEYAGLPDIEIYPIVKGNPLNGHSEVWISIKEKNN